MEVLGSGPEIRGTLATIFCTGKNVESALDRTMALPWKIDADPGTEEVERGHAWKRMDLTGSSRADVGGIAALARLNGRSSLGRRVVTSLNRFAVVWHGLLPAIVLSLFCAHAQAAQTHVRGHVVSHLTGLPVQYAYIEFRRADGTSLPGEYASTDAAGAYAWTGDCPDASGPTCIAYLYTSSFSSPLFESLHAPFANGAADAVVDFAPHELGILRGTVSGPDGAPSTGLWSQLSLHLSLPEDRAPPIALFHFDTPSSAWQRIDLPAGGYSNAAGNLYIPSLPAGRYRVCVGGIDMQLQRQCFDHQAEAGSWAKQTYTDIELAEGEQRSDLHFDLVAGGGISGTVTDAHKQRPLAEDAPRSLVRVALYDEDGVLFDHATTSLHQDSSFHIVGTPQGKFRVVTGLIDRAYLEQHVLFPGIPCTGACPLESGSQVATGVSGEASGVDLDVHPNVTIRGRVTDVETQLPIADALVTDWWLLPSDFGGTPPPPAHITHQAHTDANGNFEVYAQTDKKLYIAAQAPRYLSTCVPDSGSSCPDPLHARIPQPGDVFSGIDMALHRGAFFTGAIKDVSTGQDGPADVYIFDTSGQFVSAVRHSGAYESPPLAAGTYYVMAVVSWAYPHPVGTCQVYMGQRCPQGVESILDVTPTPVVLDYNTSRSGVDFQLVTDPLFADGFE